MEKFAEIMNAMETELYKMKEFIKQQEDHIDRLERELETSRWQLPRILKTERMLAISAYIRKSTEELIENMQANEKAVSEEKLHLECEEELKELENQFDALNEDLEKEFNQYI